MNSQQLWLPTQNLNKTKGVTIEASKGEELLQLHLQLRSPESRRLLRKGELMLFRNSVPDKVVHAPADITTLVHIQIALTGCSGLGKEDIKLGGGVGGSWDKLGEKS